MIVGNTDVIIAALFDGNAVTDVLPYITGLTIGLDMDRAPYVQGTMTLGGVGAVPGLVDMCDPRKTAGTIVRLQWTTNGLTYPLGVLGTHLDTKLYIQSYVYDAVADVVTVSFAGAESRFIDKKRIAGSTLNIQSTGTLTLAGMVGYSINDVFGGGALTDTLPASGVSIPTGDRRLMQPGESHWDLWQGELNAAGGRLYGDMTGGFWTTSRAAAPNADALASATGSAVDLDHDFAVTKVVQTVTRQGDFADGVLVKFTYVNGSGVQTTSYQASGSGVNTRGEVVEFDRTPPSANLANQIAGRSVNRGSSFQVRGSIHCGVQPGTTLTLIRAAGSMALGMVRSVEWDFTADEMTVQTEIGQPT